MEKRNHERVRTEKFTVKYKFSENDYDSIATVLNVSGGGICLLRNAPINKNDIIDILFPFKEKKIILKAQVVRIEGREVGLKFVSSEDDVAVFVNSFNREYRIIRDTTKEKEENSKSLFSKPEKSRDEDIDDILSAI